jgi:hypothetical protein
MTRGCIRRGSYLSIYFRDENVKTKHSYSILTSQSTLFLCQIKLRQDRRACVHIMMMTLNGPSHWLPSSPCPISLTLEFHICILSLTWIPSSWCHLWCLLKKSWFMILISATKTSARWYYKPDRCMSPSTVQQSSSIFSGFALFYLKGKA